MPFTEIFFPLLSALLLGMIIGLERVLTRNDAGMRTYGLMSLGSALFMLLSVRIGLALGAPGEILRVLGQIVSGIGFLGAGLIFFSKDEHKRVGMTSAASLWVTAGIGAACGLGFYLEAVTSTLLVLAALTVILKIEYFLELKLLKKEEIVKRHLTKPPHDDKF